MKLLFQNLVIFPLLLAEEVRICFLNLIKIILEHNVSEVISQLTSFASTLSKLLLDPNPSMKENCAAFIVIVSDKLKNELGHHSKCIFASLIQNTKHQRSKIRKLNIRAIGEVGKTIHAAPFLTDILDQFKPLMNDKILDVRKELYMIIKEWLECFDLGYLNMVGSTLSMFLMAGIGDENEGVAQLCVNALELHGKNLQRLLKEVGEDATVNPFSFDERFQKRTLTK